MSDFVRLSCCPPKKVDEDMCPRVLDGDLARVTDCVCSLRAWQALVE